jgi:hypothetical protein
VRLKAAAADRHTTVSEIVSAAVDQYLALPKPGTPKLTREDLENIFNDRP